MNKLSTLLLFILILYSPLLPQSLLMKPGNAVQYSLERVEIIKLCTDSVKEINGENYYLFKGFSPGELSSNFYSYEGIFGDTLYRTLNDDEIEQFVFNYNWPVGSIISSDTTNVIINTVLDSISVIQDGIWTDTLYTVNNYHIDLSSGDTITSGLNMVVSKKFGVVETPLNLMVGKKIDGIRYGIVDPFPEEIILSQDSLSYNHWTDDKSFTIYNTSDSTVRIDSLKFIPYTRFGYQADFVTDNSLTFIYFFQKYPESHSEWEDTVFIYPGDSVNVHLRIVDLCPICKQEDEYPFVDSLFFVLSYNVGNDTTGLYFEKLIVLRGDAPTGVEENEILPNFELVGNYPNPFNSSTIIEFNIRETSVVQLILYDILGRRVGDIFNEERTPGNYKVGFDAGKLNLSSGVYFLSFNAIKNNVKVYGANSKIIYMK